MMRVHLAPNRSRLALVPAMLVVAATLLGAFGASARAASGGAGPASPEAHAVSAADWPLAGGTTFNTRDATEEHLISPTTAPRLRTRWTLKGDGNYYTTPTVVKGTLYTPSNSGELSAIDARTHHVKWSKPISAYTGVSGDVSRSSPAYSDGELVLGDRHTHSGARVFAVDAATGAKRWSTTVSTHRAAYITASPEVVDGVVYVGVSSNATGFSATPGYPCCTFRGSVVALSAATGKVLWQTFMVPPNHGRLGGYSGGAVWGTTPVADPATGLVYVGTGNNYTVPFGVCAEVGQPFCAKPAADDHFDSVVALDMKTGKIVWARHGDAADTFNAGCEFLSVITFGLVPCGGDQDFGSGPNLYTTTIGGKPVQLLGVGQKTGIYRAYDPTDGHLVWKTRVGPTGLGGGILLGSAVDGRRVYVAEADSNHTPYEIKQPDGSTKTITGGSWAALDAATGKILWQTADPQGAQDRGMITVANGVVFASSAARSGDDMYVLDARTGRILKSFDSGGAINGGASVVDGTAYWGAGQETGNLVAVAPGR